MFHHRRHQNHLSNSQHSILLMRALFGIKNQRKTDLSEKINDFAGLLHEVNLTKNLKRKYPEFTENQDVS